MSLRRGRPRSLGDRTAVSSGTGHSIPIRITPQDAAIMLGRIVVGHLVTISVSASNVQNPWAKPDRDEIWFQASVLITVATCLP